MTASEARDLKGVLSVVYPGATDIQVRPEPEGALIVISGLGAAVNTQSGGNDVCMSVGNGDGPVLRMILSGRI